MLALKVYKESGDTFLLDLSPNTQLQFEQLFPAWDTDLSGGLFSLPIDVPLSAHNLKNLGYIANLHTNRHELPEQWRCDVLNDNLTIYGDCKLKTMNFAGAFDESNKTASFNVSGVKGLYGTSIRNQKLTDLALGGTITFETTERSRDFAYNTMTGANIYNDRLSFAPVGMEQFFDEDRHDYDNEFLAYSKVNNIVKNVAFTNGWLFGRPDPSAPTNVISTGNGAYGDYRTIPFFKLVYVLKKCFTEFGFKVGGTFFSKKDVEHICLFNNYAIDVYNTATADDFNRYIVPKNHVPDMLLSEFLREVKNAFNLSIDWLPGNTVIINTNNDILEQSDVKDLSTKASTTFSEGTRHPSYYGGLNMQWDFTGDDALPNDQIIDIEGDNLIATVNTYTDIAALSLPTPNFNDLILVLSENAYYKFDSAAVDWIFYTERQTDYKEGDEEFAISTKLTPLLTHYADIGTGYIHQDCVGYRAMGTYYNNYNKLIKHDFGLRMFFVKSEDTPSATNIPVSFSHNYNTSGGQRTSFSLSWLAEDSIKKFFWNNWLQLLRNSLSIKASLNLNTIDIQELKSTDIIIINQHQFLIKQLNPSIPLEVIEADLVMI